MRRRWRPSRRFRTVSFQALRAMQERAHVDQAPRAQRQLLHRNQDLSALHARVDALFGVFFVSRRAQGDNQSRQVCTTHVPDSEGVGWDVGWGVGGGCSWGCSLRTLFLLLPLQVHVHCNGASQQCDHAETLPGDWLRGEDAPIVAAATHLRGVSAAAAQAQAQARGRGRGQAAHERSG